MAILSLSHSDLLSGTSKFCSCVCGSSGVEGSGVCGAVVCSSESVSVVVVVVVVSVVVVSVTVVVSVVVVVVSVYSVTVSVVVSVGSSLLPLEHPKNKSVKAIENNNFFINYLCKNYTIE